MQAATDMSSMSFMNLSYTYGNSVIYSEYYGLITVGGQGTNGVLKTIQRLDINALFVNNDYDWNKTFDGWKCCNDMNQNRFIASSVLVPCTSFNDNGEKERLFVIGGWNEDDLSCGEVYDFRRDQWNEISNLNHARYEAGICYDQQREYIFIGGGYSWNCNKIIQNCEYYDINKNKWYQDLPKTKLEHREIPMIWIENNNLLSITSIVGDGIEYIDLRCDNKEWTVVYEKGMLMQQLFGEFISNNDNELVHRFLH